MQKNNQPDINFKLFITNRKKLLLAIAMIWGGAVLAFFVGRPEFQQIFKSYDQLEQTRDKLEKLEKKNTDLKQMGASRHFKNKEKVDEVLPSHKPLLELLTNLHQAAKKSEVAVKELALEPGAVASSSADRQPQLTDEKSKDLALGYSKLEIELTASGDRPSIDQFTSLVERIVPFSTITEMTIATQHQGSRAEARQADEKEQAETTYAEARMLITTYYYTRSIKTSLSSPMPSIGQEEIDAFEKIQAFRPTDFQPISEIQSSDIEDLFNIKGYQDLVKQN
jgi:hypothetical protein